MKYVSVDRIGRDSKDIPEGEIFCVYTEDQKCAFAAKINSEVTISQYMGKDATAKQVKIAMAQVKYALKNGWSRTQEMQLDDYDWKKKNVYRCLYCGACSLPDDIEGPCECRGPKKSPLLSNLILPGNW